MERPSRSATHQSSSSSSLLTGVEEILQGIRNDLQESMKQTAERFERMDQRFVVIESALRDMAEQMVMQSRAIKTALELRQNVEKRLDDHEERLPRPN